jgi:hypothetical protein
MKRLIGAAALALALSASTQTALAHHREGHRVPPGHADETTGELFMVCPPGGHSGDEVMVPALDVLDLVFGQGYTLLSCPPALPG